MLSFYKKHKKTLEQDSSITLSGRTEDLITQLINQLSIDIGVSDLSTFDQKSFGSIVHEEIVNVCRLGIQEKNLEQTEKELNEGKLDQMIFVEEPQLTPELKHFIENRNRDFCQILLMRATSLHTLQYWFNQGGAKLPKDALALAIHLKSSKVVFEYLKDNSDLLSNMSKQDQKDLLRVATIKLKENRKESYEFLLEHLSKSGYNKPTLLI